MSTLTIEKDNKLSQPFSKPATDESVDKTIAALLKNGINAFAFDSREKLKKKLFEMLPENAEVMLMSSVTLDTLGITEEVSNSGKYDSVRNKLKFLDKRAQKKIGSDADYSIGSVQAVTESGEILVSSATGSQLSAYAYASNKIILVVGTQKIVKDLNEGIRRIYDYCFPLEDARSWKVYNSGSKVRKILTINSEIPERITILFLKENIGF